MNKYHARKASEDGYTFDSQAEWRRYRELKLMQAAGAIRDLDVHPSWPLVVNGWRIGRYTADFSYLIGTRGLVVEDVKPTEKRARSRDYVLRCKLMVACHGISVEEVLA